MLPPDTVEMMSTLFNQPIRDPSEQAQMEQRGPKSPTGQGKRDSGLHGGAKFCWIFHRLITLRTSQGSEGDHEGLNRIPTSTRRLPSEDPIIQYMIVGFHSCPFSQWITGRGSIRLFSFNCSRSSTRHLLNLPSSATASRTQSPSMTSARIALIA